MNFAAVLYAAACYADAVVKGIVLSQQSAQDAQQSQEAAAAQPQA